MIEMVSANGLSPQEWNQAIAGLPGAHVLQTWQWGDFKAHFGWSPAYWTWRQEGVIAAAALVLTRAAPGGLSVQYIPRGPLLDWKDEVLRARVLDDVQRLAHRRGVIFIKMDPETPVGWGIPGSQEDRTDSLGAQLLVELAQRGWHESSEQIQFKNSAWLDLTGDEQSWLDRMKPKSRYNLRLAERKGVVVRTCADAELPLLYSMYAETSVRDGFVIRPESYYLQLWRSFMAQGLAEPLLAEVAGEPVAGLLLFHFAGRAWYLYGMSRAVHRDKMPNYMLQWQAMQRAKAAGCHVYDLWGAPDVFDESDSMWGVFRFKEGLGAQVVRTPGAWDFSARPVLLNLYTHVLPKVLDVMRRRGKAETRRQVSL